MDVMNAFSSANMKFLLAGLGVTVEVAVISILFSFLLGIVFALIRYAKVPVLSQIIHVWVETIRNLPLLLIIFFAFFAVPGWLHVDFSKKQAVIFALVLFESALISEIIRGGLLSVSRGQMEVARSTGLSYIQTLRFIILPQALRRMIPPLVSQFITIIKDTSLGIIIALEELMHNAQIIYNQKVSYVFPVLLVVALLYFVINYSLSIVSRKLEQRLQA